MAARTRPNATLYIHWLSCLYAHHERSFVVCRQCVNI